MGHWPDSRRRKYGRGAGRGKNGRQTRSRFPKMAAHQCDNRSRFKFSQPRRYAKIHLLIIANLPITVYHIGYGT